MKRSFDPLQTREFTRRHDALVTAIREAGLDYFVATTADNIFYLTGATFEPLERPFFLIVGMDGSRRMVVPALERDHLGKAWGIEADCVLAYRDFPAPEGQGWAEQLLNTNLGSTLFSFDDGTPWTVANVLLKADGIPADLIGELRLVKSDWEIAQIERAAHYADWGVSEILRKAWNGASAAETYMPSQSLQRKIIRELPDWDALATKIIAGAWPAPISAEPHSVPRLTDRLRAGPHVAMVLTRVNGYAAESERTFFTQRPTAREREMFSIMERARQMAFDMVRPGMECAAIDAAVNSFMSEAGFADYQTRLHRCGHGFGLSNHEPPWIAEGSSHVLQKNMVISIEPALYERGIGGYRHSDTVLVTAYGYRSLTRSPLDIESLTVARTTLRHRLNSWAVAKALGMGRRVLPQGDEPQ
ncbi:Xaa-Pro dipeptidase [Variovorax boronicumulans]|uniref:M24 family metallopeptidase n=1 Tax=Variovorax boronicumulans TaxID=436515 RepID=UPI0027878EC7|nr:Xaa-Pro peptidase family protein [Variovorax boronicumulans]MDP9995155.1 Xaa-Pro dipeptidase [Variovorax boronicumulans]MDQ0006445.1 Xaa-Pro dipeptidase [Variovorax boronicumulans]